MSMTDPIADFLTRIRNGVSAGHEQVEIGGSRMKQQLARILQEQGYIDGFETRSDGPKSTLSIRLKYRAGGGGVIRGIQRVSKPGRRVYCGAREIPQVLNGLGISIISTSRGVLSDDQARDQRVGGEVLCQVW